MEKTEKPPLAAFLDENEALKEMVENGENGAGEWQRRLRNSNLVTELRGSESQWRKVARVLISLDDKPLSQTAPEHIRELHCNTISLSYSAVIAKGERKNPFLLRCSFLKKENFRFSSMQELKEKAKTDAGLAWLLRWSNIGQVDVDIFKSDTKLMFPIAVRLDEYIRCIKAQLPNISPYYSVLMLPEVAKLTCIAKENYLISQGLLDPKERMKFDDD